MRLLSHIAYSAALKTFGKARIEFKLSEQHRPDVQKHNKIVQNNRYIVCHLIEAVYFLAEQELPFRGHIENKHSTNRANYVKLLTTIRKFDDKLDSHFKNAIEQWAFQTNPTSQRYCVTAGTSQARQKKDCSSSWCGNAVALHVFNCLRREYDYGKKLVAQTYDCAALKSVNITVYKPTSGPNTSKLSSFIIVSYNANNVTTLSVFAAVFQSPLREPRSLTRALTIWSYNSKLVETVFENKPDWLNLLECMIENGEKWDVATDKWPRLACYMSTSTSLSFISQWHFLTQTSATEDYFEITDTIKTKITLRFCDIKCLHFIGRFELKK
ncbi:hypothetical protein PR048_016041, partial [Dryococelus australis]